MHYLPLFWNLVVSMWPCSHFSGCGFNATFWRTKQEASQFSVSQCDVVLWCTRKTINENHDGVQVWLPYSHRSLAFVVSSTKSTPAFSLAAAYYWWGTNYYCFEGYTLTTSHTGTTPKPCHPPVLCAIVFIPVNGKNGKGTIVKRHAVLEQVFDLDAKKHTHEIGMHSSSIMICVLPRTTANSSSWMEFVKIWLTRTHKFVPWSTRKNLCSSNYATDPFLTVISVNPQFVSGVCGILKIHACLPKVLFTKSLTTSFTTCRRSGLPSKGTRGEHLSSKICFDLEHLLKQFLVKRMNLFANLTISNSNAKQIWNDVVPW